MKTTKEMIEVMQAYERGEQIEFKDTIYNKSEWSEIPQPSWDWYHNDYRVKPKKKYVPFETAEEFLAAQREKGIYVFFGGYKYTAYINSNGSIRLIPPTNILQVIISDLEKMLLEECTFADGTPCGKEVEV
ncbi:MAG: hypothetical protein ACI30J_08930 [Paludibacteraceae bacterium]